MSRQTRVAFISHSRRLYGASRSLLVLLEGFRAAGIEVCTLLPGPGAMADALALRGLPATVEPFPCWVSDAPERVDLDAWRAGQARAVPRVVRHLERFRPDVVWTNTSLAAVGALAAAALDLPHVWHLREVNGAPGPFRFLVGTAPAMDLMRTARARVGVSRVVCAFYETLGSGPCDAIDNGIGSAEALVRRQIPPPRRGPLRVLLPARLRPEKGQLAAVAAMRQLRSAGHDVRLRIVGGGEEEAIAQAVARSGVADAVTLAGFVAEMDPEYRRADVVLSCSPIEGMGRTTAEAMSYGLPVVGCDSLGTAELIEHAVTGLLCDGSAAGVAGALARLLGDPTAARRMGANAQRMARERFTNERCTAASLALLARVIAGRPGLHGSQLPACPE